jgi:hypothetical protein
MKMFETMNMFVYTFCLYVGGVLAVGGCGCGFWVFGLFEFEVGSFEDYERCEACDNSKV